MQSFPFYQVDAFTDRPLAGNPCAVVFDSDDLSPATMLAIAREMNLSETAFVRRSLEADFAVRFFTPAEEIPLAGHPTIATVYALVTSGRLALSAERQRIQLELLEGPIAVEIIASGGTIQEIIMTQRRPRFMATYPAQAVLPLFGLDSEAALPEVSIQTVSTGTPQLMIPLRDLEYLRQARMDIPAYDNFRAEADFFSPHLFCLEGVTPAGQTFARHFGSPPDLLEDPFTGSATGGMAAYLWHYGLLETADFVAEQGHWLDRPGRASVQVVGAPEEITAIRVGGSAALVAHGELLLPD